MKSFHFSARPGAIGNTLGALLALCGYILLSHYILNHDVETMPQSSLGFVIGPALIVLVMSVYCWFWKGGRVFLTLSLIITFLALVWHGTLNFEYAVFRCFMAFSCPPVPSEVVIGFLLPYVGYLLGGLGLVIAYVAQQPKTGKAVSVSKQD